MKLQEQLTHTLDRTPASLPAEQPDLVRQEIWGFLIAYTLLHRQMRLMARHVKVAPSRMGFHAAAGAIIDILRFAPLASDG